MILQEKLENRAYNISYKPLEKPTQSLTIPGAGFNIKLAMEQYKRGTLVERVKGYYEKQDMVVPDFNQMDRIQKLEALAHFRQVVKDKTAKLDAAHLEAIKKQQAHVLEQKQKQKEASESGKRSGDTTKPPDAK